MERHIVKSFGEELDRLQAIIREMGGETRQQLLGAADALRNRDAAAAVTVIDRDCRVDELHQTVDDLTVRMLALRQPMADDLRLIVSSLRIASDLERVADYAANIARLVSEISGRGMGAAIDGILRMTGHAAEMLDDVMRAYETLDNKLAADVWRRDTVIDREYEGLIRDLRNFMTDNPDSVTACTALLFVSRCCERIGDHITNVAENIHFIVTGEMPRPEGLS